jgi:MurNAc alpha-1-phosphate uridylyltransferase
MLMTAGLGERLRPYTRHLAKPFLPLLGRPVVDYSIQALVNAGVDRFVANLHHLPDSSKAELERVASTVRERLPNQLIDWRWSDERKQLLGSAGGLRQALVEFQEEPFFLINGDVLMDIDFQKLAEAHRRNKKEFGALFTLAIHRCSPGVGRYNEVFLKRQGAGMSITGLRGRDQLRANVPFYTGCAVIEPEVLRPLPQGVPVDFVVSCLIPAIEAGRAGALEVDGAWYDIGSPELWWKTHLDLIRSYEERRLPSAWLETWDLSLQKIAPGFYCSRGHGIEESVSGCAELIEPLSCTGYLGASTPGNIPFSTENLRALATANSTEVNSNCLREVVFYGLPPNLAPVLFSKGVCTKLISAFGGVSQFSKEIGEG